MYLLYSKFTQWEILLWIIWLGASRCKNAYDVRTLKYLYFTLNLSSGKSCCGSFGLEPADLRTCILNTTKI